METQLVYLEALGAMVLWGSLGASWWSNLLYDLGQDTSCLWSSITSLCFGNCQSVIDTLFLTAHPQSIDG